MTQATHGAQMMTPEQVGSLVDTLAQAFSHSRRSPILKTPADVGLPFEALTFPSADGVPLEAWFIPRAGSDRLIIANHPMGFSRYGFPSHLEPWRSVNAAFGNDFEVDFLPDYRILHGAGYNVLTYDLRNFGHSGAANGGLTSGGLFEARDVLGSLAYVRTREDLRDMRVGLFSRCLGCNATLFAMAAHPAHFRDVRCLVALQPLSPRCAMQRRLEHHGAPASAVDDLITRVRLITSFTLDEMSPVAASKSVAVPTLMAQVHDDRMTEPLDVRAMFDNLPVSDKRLVWIEGTTRRWDGYLHFQREPGQMLEWFGRHLS